MPTFMVGRVFFLVVPTFMVGRVFLLVVPTFMVGRPMINIGTTLNKTGERCSPYYRDGRPMINIGTTLNKRGERCSPYYTDGRPMINIGTTSKCQHHGMVSVVDAERPNSSGAYSRNACEPGHSYVPGVTVRDR